mgnify:CR=1 FL=1
MYSDKKNVLQLVALLRAHGVRRAVLCPGTFLSAASAARAAFFSPSTPCPLGRFLRTLSAERGRFAFLLAPAAGRSFFVSLSSSDIYVSPASPGFSGPCGGTWPAPA